MHEVLCAECGLELKEASDLPADQGEPCPDCGSTNRRFGVLLEGGITLHSQLRYKGREEGKGRPFVEGLVGADWSHRLKRWLRKVRLIDRRGDRYLETVTDPDTGDVIHLTEERLSEHRGHGSDKPSS